MTDSLDGEFSPQKIAQTHGPKCRFEGSLLFAEEFDAQRGDMTDEMEV